MKLSFAALMAGIALLLSCSNMKEKETIGSIERLRPALDEIVSEKAEIEVLGEGYEWSEGPVWVASEQMLLFSDVPKNTVYRWTEEGGVTPYLSPSGYTGTEPSQSREPGSNGLALTALNELLLCQHGDRRVARMESGLSSPTAEFVSVAERWNGKRFNSPNDLAVRTNGDVFFTDPPYGLPQQENDPTREIPFQGVYKVSQGKVTLLIDSLTRPNGLAFARDEKVFYVANSDPGKAAWYRFELGPDDSIDSTAVFYDATAEAAKEQGLPDGLKVDRNGNVFATGPGGLWIFNAAGQILGKIKLPVPAANCALTQDEKTLFITADSYLLRVRLRE